MSLIKNNPFLPSQKVNHFIDEFFNRSLGEIIGSDFALNSPAVNMIDEKDAFKIELAVPGLEKEDFNILIEADNLKISAKKEVEGTTEKEKYTRREFNYLSFSRSFHLGGEVDTNGIDATYQKGVLKITVPKKVVSNKDLSRTIKIS